MGKASQEQIGLSSSPPAGAPPKTAAPAGEADSAARRRVLAYLALGAAMILWSSTFILIKVVLTAYHPFTMTFVRMGVSVAAMAPFGLRLLRQIRYSPGDWKPLLLLVLAEPCLYFIFEGFALRYTSASEAAMVISLLPLCVGVGAFFFLRERLSRMVWWGFFTAVAGVAVLTFSGEATTASPDPLLGNMLEAGAVLMATAYILCVRRLTGFPAFCIVAFQSLAGLIFFGALTFAVPGAGLPASPGLLPTIMLVALGFISIFGYGLFNVGVAMLSAGQATAWNNLIPGITLIMGMLFLGERFTTLQYLSLIPIFLGVAISQCGKVGTGECG